MLPVTTRRQQTGIKRRTESGNVRLLAALGAMYQSGRGVVQNEDTAVQWCGKAAERGDGAAGEALRRIEAVGRDKAPEGR